MSSSRLPDLDEPCGKHHTYRDLVECGETWEAFTPDNSPRELRSYNALQELAERVLDPIWDEFGKLTVTYGFAGPGLYRRIRKQIAPTLDQHVAYERNAKGRLICERGGAACDLIVGGVNSADVAQWVAGHTDFDRIYYYGTDRPVHISVSANPVRKCTVVERSKTGRARPITYSQRGFLKQVL